MTAINPDSIWVLSALDKFMSDFKKDPKMFCALFEKKQLIIGLLQSKKIDAKKYKSLLGKSYKEENGIIKKYAEGDLMKIKDAQNDQAIENWFKEIIQATGQSYQDQTKVYNMYKKQQPPTQPEIKKQQPPAITNSTKNVVNGPNTDELVSFKTIDNMLDENDSNVNIYQQLLQRKQKLLSLISSKVLTADKYKATLQLFIKKTKNQELISDYKMEIEGIEDFHDGNTTAWFKEIVEETQEKYDDQFKLLQTLQKGNISKPKPQEKQQENRISKQIKGPSKAPETGYNINELVSFKVIEDQLQKLTKNKDRYKQVLQKKKNFLNLISKGGLNSSKYKALLIKAISEARNQQIKESMEFQLSELSEFHENNLEAWFRDIVSNAQLLLQDQEQILNKLQKGIKIEDDDFNLDDDDDDIDLDVDDLKIVKKKSVPAKIQPTKPKQNPPQQPSSQAKSNNTTGINFEQIYSLKAIDQYLTEFEKNPNAFCLCFQRKQAIFEMMKKGQIDPSRYKQLQQATIKKSSNQKLKQSIEMELEDLKDMYDNNVQDWFENVVNDAGFNYQDQQELYNKLKGNKVKPSTVVQISKQEVSISKKIVKPNITQLVCFTAVDKLFNHCLETVDIVYYKQLSLKREKLIQLVTQGRLISNKYRDINKATVQKTENNFLKATIAEQQKKLISQFGGNENSWFDSLFKKLSLQPPQLKLPQNPQMKKINASSVAKKVEYLIRKMAVYQSLLQYFNKYEINNNKFASDYEKNRKKQAIQAIELIQKDPSFDVYNLAENLFPNIDQTIFYGETLPALKKKAQTYAGLFGKQKAAIKDYSEKIKKATNPENIEISKKEMAKCDQNISYLKSWPSGLTAFPVIKEEKVQKYNLDIFRHLDKNQVEIIVTSIEGVREQIIFKVFVADFEHERYFSKLKPNQQNGFKFIVKLPPKDNIDLFKGDKKIILFRAYEVGFFGGQTLIGQNAIETSFIRNNIIQQRVQVGKFIVSYVLHVQKPTKPLITEIIHYELNSVPPFKTDQSVQQKLMNKYSLKK